MIKRAFLKRIEPRRAGASILATNAVRDAAGTSNATTGNFGRPDSGDGGIGERRRRGRPVAHPDRPSRHEPRRQEAVTENEAKRERGVTEAQEPRAAAGAAGSLEQIPPSKRRREPGAQSRDRQLLERRTTRSAAVVALMLDRGMRRGVQPARRAEHRDDARTAHACRGQDRTGTTRKGSRSHGGGGSDRRPRTETGTTETT